MKSLEALNTDIRDLMRAAYIQGATDVQNNYRPLKEGEDPEFGEAADDYVADVLDCA